ncbi:hypothetical protein [Hymenobacter negativus]|uniref:MolR family transcriptional regulator n=1 Tax=Hymenobacter negativus TaxID=2795026 RepID=A0ABS0Q2V4_9BACT|nr:hypothetical protein [Hymenobacter negativus]MBH8556972.1 hypothetical protein [Hymenobacter negativus]
MSTYYFDDQEEGLARETSHPVFVEHATADFYYDQGDDFSPFGNDSGNDTLANLEEWYQERTAGAKAATFLRNMIVNEWGFDATYLDVIEPAQLDVMSRDELSLNGETDKAVIATAFGQFKIAGQADKAILRMATDAFRRQRHEAEKATKRENNPWEYAEEFLTRLDIMEADLAAMANKKAR